MPKLKKPKKARNRNTKSDDFGKKNWFFTWNNYTSENIREMLNWLEKRKNMKYIFQEEVGEKGTPHLQGAFSCKSPVMFETLVNRFPKVHFRPARNIHACRNYCSKEDTRNGKVYACPEWEPIRDPLKGKELYPWQKEVIDLVATVPDERSIYWYWSDEGNIGKTSLAKHICIHNPGKVLYVSGSYRDIMQNVKKAHKALVFNIPRCSRDRTGDIIVSYKAMEAMKDGIFYSGKYEGGMTIMNCPHVIVFANQEPEYEKMSIDRWIVKKISKSIPTKG